MKNLIIILCLLVLISCNKKKRELTGIEYSVKVGNWWEYLREKNNTKDTIKIEVIEEPSKGYFVCTVSENSLVVDSSVFIIQDNLLSYKGIYENELFSNFKLDLPFKNNKFWIGNNIQDTVRVTSYMRNIEIKNKKYKSVFTVERNYTLGGGFSFSQELIIGTDVGVIQQKIKSFDGAYFHNETFNLLNYYVH